MYIADTYNSRVRKSGRDGIISSIDRPEVLQRLDANIYRRASLAPVAIARAATDAAR